LAQAEREHASRKAEVLQRMRATKNGTYTPAELALVEDSDQEDEGEKEIQRLVEDRKPTLEGGSYAPSAAADAEIRSHVALPTQEDISELLLAEKRKALLAKLSAL
jgi:hypothetical protein